MKIRMAAAMTRPAKFWIDGTIFSIGKSCENAKLFKTEESLDDGQISTTFRLPLLYYDKMYKDPRFDLSKIKRTKSTEITLPTRGIPGNVKISGNTLDEVTDAREEFHSMVELIRQNIRPMQFIAIPTLSEEIKTNFVKFKEELLTLHKTEEGKIVGLEESVFQKPEKLHITVCVLALLDDVELDAGKRLLQELKETILLPIFKDKGEIKLRLKGISCMDRNLKKTNVLYANASIADETTDLQMVANKISDFFYEKGVMKEMKDAVKIHVTLINTKYRKTKTNQRREKKKWGQRIPIDASAIMDAYKDYDFGTCHFDSVHLSLMSKSTTDVKATGDNNGFYTPLSVVKL